MKEGENKICESIIFRKKSILGGTIMQLVKTKKCEKYCRNTGIKYFRFYEQWKVSEISSGHVEISSITHGHILTEWPGLAEVKGIHTWTDAGPVDYLGPAR